MDKRPSRRQYLATLGAASIAGVAGCSQEDSPTQSTQTEAPTSNLGGANFSFDYSAVDQQVTIQFNGGADILAGNLQVRSSTGVQAEWAQLGSSVASPEERISTGATAILGPDILNWDQPVEPDETIRLVYVAAETPATLGRFTPTESATLTSTVPSTSTPEPTDEPTEPPTDTPTDDPDTTVPSITAFSLSNPSGQELRTSFEADEALASIEVTISGAESVSLRTGDFSDTVSGGTYTYEATHQASSDGDYTATLNEAADESGNDGASGQSVTISVTTTSSGLVTTGFPRFQYDNQNSGGASAITGPTGSVSNQWTFTTDGNNHTTPVIHNGTAYFGGGGGSNNSQSNVYAADIADGSEQWRFEHDTAFNTCGALSDDAYFIADSDGTLFALDPSDGTELWRAEYGSQSYTAAPVPADGGVYIGDADTGGLYGFDTQTGDQVWSFDTATAVGSAPALGTDTVYFGTTGGTVSAVQTSDATTVWEVIVDDEVRGAPTLVDDTVYVTTAGGTVYALDANDGTELWQAPTDQIINSSAAVNDGTVYVGDGDLFDTPGKLYAFDAATGAEQWTFDTEGSYGGREGAILNAPTVAGGYVYFGVDGNKIYAVDASDGSEEWVYDDVGVVLSSPAVYDGVLYTGADDNSIYALA
jgi:outer membrane protein assembly factor BamB